MTDNKILEMFKTLHFKESEMSIEFWVEILDEGEFCIESELP